MSWSVRGVAWSIAAVMAAFAARDALARGKKMPEAEAKMFAASAEYDRFMGRWSRLLAPKLVVFAGVKDGDLVLDVGTGTGSLASAIGARMPACRIVGVDPSAAFVAHAQRNAKSSHANFEVGDAQALRFDSASFDHTLSLLVMNFIPDHEKAIAEMRRVTRSGGRVSACVWDYDEGMQSLRFFWDAAISLDPAIEPKDERHMKLSRKGQLGALWRKAGLVNVQEKPLGIDQAFSSFDDYWGPFTKGAGPAGAYVLTLPNDRRHQLAARLRKRILDDRADVPFVLSARAWCVTGQVPKP